MGTLRSNIIFVRQVDYFYDFVIKCRKLVKNLILGVVKRILKPSSTFS